MAPGLYQVRDVLERAGICRTTLYDWERKGKIPRARRNVSRYRVYTEDEVKQIEDFAHTLYPPEP